MKEKQVEYIKNNLSEDKWNVGKKLLDEGVSPQYIVGNVDFYGNIINVDKRVLIPRFETELLVEKTIGYINKFFDNKVNILDIGTGSGCIAITLKKEIDCDVSAVDVSIEALKVAKNNAKLNDVNINFINSDIFSNVRGKYDVIISNPPYISYDEEIEDIVYNNEPHLALFARDKGLYFYNKILSECSKYLNDKYLICFEIGCNQGDKVIELAFKYLDDINVSLEKDYSDRDRFVFIWKN